MSTCIEAEINRTALLGDRLEHLIYNKSKEGNLVQSPSMMTCFSVIGRLSSTIARVSDASCTTSSTLPLSRCSDL